MHPTDGELRAFYDQELGERIRARVEEHLAVCAPCQERLEALVSRAAFTHQQLDRLAPDRADAGLSPAMARHKLATRLADTATKEVSPMWKQLFSPQKRPVLVAGLVMLALVLAFAFPQVRAIATDFLGLFRVEQIRFVEVNPANMPDSLGSSTLFEQMLAENLQIEDFGEPQPIADPAEARTVAGFPIRLPQQLDAPDELLIQPGSRLTFEVDLPRLQGLLREIGRADIQLPPDLQGAIVTLEVPTSVQTGFGDCDFSARASEDEVPGPPRQSDCLTLVQMPSPTLSAPEGLNLPELGKAYLQLTGMTAEEAEKFSSTVDWTTTLVIPIPQYGVEYRQVTVDGVEGTLMLQQDRPGEGYMLIWVKEGMIYALTGQRGSSQALRIANSMK